MTASTIETCTRTDAHVCRRSTPDRAGNTFRAYRAGEHGSHVDRGLGPFVESTERAERILAGATITPGRVCGWCAVIDRPAAVVEFRVGRGSWALRGFGVCADHEAPARASLLASYPDRMIYVRTVADPRTREVTA